jgi:transcriptional regulator with XRE-family HTH domain
MVKVDPELAELGRAVRAAREARHLSQEELAYRSGLHRNYIGGIERGERNVGVKALLRIAKAFGLHPAKLLEECQFARSKSKT